MGWREQHEHRRRVSNKWIFTGVAATATSVYAGWHLHYKNAMKVRRIPSTDQVSRGNDFGSDGRKVEAKPGADEQNKFRWPWDNDDDDLSGGASTGDGAYGPGGVDSEFDAEQMIAVGSVAVVIALCVLGVVWALTRNGGSSTRHAHAF